VIHVAKANADPSFLFLSLLMPHSTLLDSMSPSPPCYPILCPYPSISVLLPHRSPRPSYIHLSQTTPRPLPSSGLSSPSSLYQQDPSAHLTATKRFTPPTPPTAPASIASSLAADLQSYDTTEVTLASSPSSSASGEATSAGSETDVKKMNVDELFEHLRKDVPKPEAEHH
jgi:hypothetical protein